MTYLWKAIPIRLKKGWNGCYPEYLWGDKCTLAASELDALISRFTEANKALQLRDGRSAANCIALECPEDTPISLLTEKLVNSGIWRKFTSLDDTMNATSDRFCLTTKEDIAQGKEPRETFFYHYFFKNEKDNWVSTNGTNYRDSDYLVKTFNKGDILYLMPTYDR